MRSLRFAGAPRRCWRIRGCRRRTGVVRSRGRGASGAAVTLTDPALAAELAETAGRLLLGVRDELGFSDRWALGSAGDKRANTLILDRLRGERAEHRALGE